MLRLKEDSKEWRKSVLLTVPALALVSALLCWRRILPITTWLAILVLLVIVSVAAFARPRWFRGYYRFSMRVGFGLSQVIARVVLVLVFALLITPLGLLLRLTGKDLLGLKRAQDRKSYWADAKESSPLDRMF